jgi:hypothetical protein
MLFLPVTAGLLWLFVLLIARSLWSGKDSPVSASAKPTPSFPLDAHPHRRARHARVVAGRCSAAGGRYACFTQTYVLQAVAAAAIVGAVVLGGQIPKLLRWNRDPYTVGNMEVNE